MADINIELADEIKKLIQKIARTYMMTFVKICDFEIVSVDKDNYTCIGNSVTDGVDMNEVSIRIIPEISDGSINYPALGSTVTVAFSDYLTPVIINDSDLQEKFISIGNQSWQMIEDGQKFNDGKYGGLAIVEDPENPLGGLTKRYNEIEDDINDLKQKLNIILPVVTTLSAALSGLGGSPVPASTLAPFFTSLTTNLTPYAAQQLIKTSNSDIENKSITHGDKVEQ